MDLARWRWWLIHTGRIGLDLKAPDVLRKPLQRWPLIALLVVATAMVGACVGAEFQEETDSILERLGQASAPTGSIELDGEVLVYAPDLPDLAIDVRAVADEEGKREVVEEYLTMQERIDCILEDIEQAADDDTDLNCQGKNLVKKQGKHGLLGVSELLEEVTSRASEPATREYLAGYLRYWDEVQRIDRVEDSLSQMKRTRAIPLFGRVVNTIHRFPIMYEGDILVPKKDLSMLQDEFRSLSTEDARRDLVEEYLNR